MTRVFSKIALCSLMLFLDAPLSEALVMTPVGPGGGPIPGPGNTVVIPAPLGAVVVIDMSGCFEMHPAPTPAVAVACGPPGSAGNTLTVVAGAAGAAFSVVGFALSAGGGSPGGVTPCAAVFVAGAAAGPINISALDQNGAGGFNAADMSLFLGDRDSGPKNQARSDFNNSGSVNPADGSYLLAFLFGGGAPGVVPAGACP